MTASAIIGTIMFFVSVGGVIGLIFWLCSDNTNTGKIKLPNITFWE